MVHKFVVRKFVNFIFLLNFAQKSENKRCNEWYFYGYEKGVTPANGLADAGVPEPEITGTFESVVLESQEGIPSKARVWAQDLIAKKATDITDEVVIEGNRMTLSGDLIQRIGTQAATPGDKSAPALVLQVKRQ